METGAAVIYDLDSSYKMGIAHSMILKKDEVRGKLLEYLVKSESDIPCDYLNGSNYCCETCNYDNPVKECWIKWAEAEIREESEDKE